MSELLSTLPGDIPGLLRRGSPMHYIGPDRYRRGWVGLVEQVHADGTVRVAWDAGIHGVEVLASLALDLTDPTGRAHAAWWVGAQPAPVQLTVSSDEACTVIHARAGSYLDEEEIDTLARLVLRLAGRAS